METGEMKRITYQTNGLQVDTVHKTVSFRPWGSQRNWEFKGGPSGVSQDKVVAFINIL